MNVEPNATTREVVIIHMGTQRIQIDGYGTHEEAVRAGKAAVEAAKSNGLPSPHVATVTNHPGGDDESTTDLLAG